MKHFVINGKFMADRMQDVVRYGRELVNALDCLIDNDIEVELAVPSDAHDVPTLKNIKVSMLAGLTGIAWEQVTLAKYLREHPEFTGINFCNTVPLFTKPGITTIHDIMYRAHPEYCSTTRNRISRLRHMFQYWYATRHEKLILTCWSH